MPDSDERDEVFKPLPGIRNLPFVNLRFARPRYIVLAVAVWIASFLLIQVLGGYSDPTHQPPERVLAQGIVLLSFGLCCLGVLFKPTLEDAVLARHEHRPAFRKDLWSITFLFLILGGLAIFDAVRGFTSQ